MKKLAALVLVVAVAVMFSVPAFAGCSACAKPCAKPCNTCPQPKPCVTCGQPCNIIQSTANAVNSIQAPDLCPKCSACPKPCAKPCNTCTK
jgi:hypothetical protein